LYISIITPKQQKQNKTQQVIILMVATAHMGHIDHSTVFTMWFPHVPPSNSGSLSLFLNGVSISSAISAGLTVSTNRQTCRQTVNTTYRHL